MSTAEDRATAPTPTTTPASPPDPPGFVLRGVPYRLYCRLRDLPENYHVRMTYHNGTLEFMSPAQPHEVSSRLLGQVVIMVAAGLDIPCMGLGATTFRRAGAGPRKGSGKEPDQCFYIAHAERAKDEEKDINIEAGDPPPDLWIEVDNRSSSRGREPLYATLGVPELWRYRPRTRKLAFLRLTEAGAYEPIERSLALPMLTPALVMEALSLRSGLTESEWIPRLMAWVRDRLGPGRA